MDRAKGRGVRFRLAACCRRVPRRCCTAMICARSGNRCARPGATSSRGMTAEARAEIDRCHRAVVAAESEVFDAKRKARPQAAERYEAAVAAEKRALDDAGVDSYAGFLFAITGGDQALDTDARRVA